MSDRLPSYVAAVQPQAKELNKLSWPSSIIRILCPVKIQKKVDPSLPNALSANAQLILERAKKGDLETLSPLGAFQLTIERINKEAKDEPIFKAKLAIQLFSKKESVSEKETNELWTNSPERRLINEIYTVIKMQSKLRNPISFSQALVQTYENKSKNERIVLDRITKELIFNR